MEVLPLLLVALLALMPSALALKCQECTNVPGYTAAAQCSAENVPATTCGLYMDKCMTVKGTFKIPGAGSLVIEMKNCTNSVLCDPDNQWNMCKLLNITGMMSDCKSDCCAGDMCNGGGSVDGSGATRVSSLANSFAAIFLTVILSLIPGFY